MNQVHVLSASDVELPASKPKPTSTTGQREASVALAGLKTADVGVWECDEGTFAADRTETAEICTILSGRAIITTKGSPERHEVGPGSLFVLSRGWTGTWIVLERIRKTYVMLSDDFVQPRSDA